MAITIGRLSRLLAAGGMRHHVDLEEDAIRVVVVTRWYKNLRGERLAILRVVAADAGGSCRVSLDRGFAAGRSPARTCLALCRTGGSSVAVAVEEDAPSRTFRLVSTVPVEDGRLTPRQLGAILDAVVAAAEAAADALQAAPERRHRGGGKASASHRAAA